MKAGWCQSFVTVQTRNSVIVRKETGMVDLRKFRRNLLTWFLRGLKNLSDESARFFQVLLTDTTIRLEYVPTVAPKGLAVELRIGKINYVGDAASRDNAMTNRCQCHK